MKLTDLLCVFLLGIALHAKDATSEQLEAEGFFVLDNKALDLYLREENYDVQKAKEALKQDVELWLYDVNAYYKTLEEYDLKIRISIVDIQYLSFDLHSVVTNGDEVDKDVTLNSFGTFLKGKNPQGQPSKDAKDYDFAMFFTGYDITGAKGIAGYARPNGMCIQGSAYGIAEWTGATQSSQLIAHEIGHILGCKHDPADAVTVMVATSKPTTNLDKYKFSKQSADEIKAHLKYLASSGKSNCLKLPSRPGSRLPSVTPDTYTGRGQDPETICQRSVYPESSPCTEAGFYKNKDGSYKTSLTGDDICLRMYCHQNNTGNICSDIRPMEGMRCAVGKSCRRGLCVSDARPAFQNVNAQCLFGDDKDPLTGKGLSCEQAIRTMPEGARACLQLSSIGTSCCETCPKYHTGDLSCPYGDVNKMPFTDGSKLSCADAITKHGTAIVCEKSTRCCQTCQKILKERGSGPNCKYGDDKSINFNKVQTTCDAMIKKYGYLLACETNDYLKTRCCASCKKRREESGAGPNCKYGDEDSITVDKIQMTCSAIIKKWGYFYACDTNDYMKTRCCASCKKRREDSGAGPNCKYGDEDSITFDNIQTTCAAVIKEKGYLYACETNDYLKIRCCASCKKRREESGTGPNCKYGDDQAVKVNQKQTTCEAVVKTYRYQMTCVTNDYLKTRCCGTCHKREQEKGVGPNCKYGDEDSITVNKIQTTCASMIKKWGYFYACETNDYMKTSCCASCKKRREDSGAGPDCKYGDEDFITFNKIQSTCAAAIKERGYLYACETNDYLKTRCCASCKKRREESGVGPNCKYGDDESINVNQKQTTCDAVAKAYGFQTTCVRNDYIKTRCCGTCHKRREEKGAGPNCKYGDEDTINFNKKQTTCGAMLAKWGYQFACEKNDYLKTGCCSSCQAQKAVVSAPSFG